MLDCDRIEGGEILDKNPVTWRYLFISLLHINISLTNVPAMCQVTTCDRNPIFYTVIIVCRLTTIITYTLINIITTSSNNDKYLMLWRFSFSPHIDLEQADDSQ
jgi:hypothetical protein